MKNKVVITAALTGVMATRKQCKYIPYTPKEIALEGKRAVDAGASILHIHARNNDGSPSYELETYSKIHQEVRKLCPDVIINYSTGAIGITNEQRIYQIDVIKPEAAALNMGSMNYAIYSKEKKKFYFDFVFKNAFSDIIYFMEHMKAAGTKPEMECFDNGHINNSIPIIDLGIMEKPYLYSLVMGVLGGIAPTTENLLHQVKTLPKDSVWQVIGIGRKQWSLAAAALTIGGNFRVGLEDNFYLPEGEMAKSNGELVDAACHLARLLGKEPTTIAETRELYNIHRIS